MATRRVLFGLIALTLSSGSGLAQQIQAPVGSRLVLTGTVVAGKTATGSVIDPSGRTLAGVVVAVGGGESKSDDNGLFEIPVPDAAGSAVEVSLTDAGGGRVEQSLPVITAPPNTLVVPRIDRAPQYTLAGDIVSVLGAGFSGIAGENDVRLGGSAVPALAASGAELVLAPPVTSSLGEQELTVETAEGTSEPVLTQVVLLTLSSDDTQLATGQRGTASVEIQGTDDEVTLTITNQDPSVIALETGMTAVVSTSGGEANSAQLSFVALRPGGFLISVALEEREVYVPEDGWVPLLQADTSSERQLCEPAPEGGVANAEESGGEVLCQDIDDAVAELDQMDHPSANAIRARAQQAADRRAQVREGHLALAQLRRRVELARTVEQIRAALDAAAAAKGPCPKVEAMENEIKAAEQRSEETAQKIADAYARKGSTPVEGMAPWQVNAVTLRETYWDNFMLTPAFREGFIECAGQMVIGAAGPMGRARLSAETYIDVLRDELLKGLSWEQAAQKAIAEQIAATEKAAGPLGGSKGVVKDALGKLAACQRKQYEKSLRAWITEERVFSGLSSAQIDEVMRIFFTGPTAEEQGAVDARRSALAAVDLEISTLEKQLAKEVAELIEKLVAVLTECVQATGAEVRRLFLYQAVLSEYARYIDDHEVFKERLRIPDVPSPFETFCERLAGLVANPPLEGATAAERKFLRAVQIAFCGEEE